MISVTAGLTALLEVLVLSLDRENRRWQFWVAAVVINIVTNVSLNLALMQIEEPLTLWSWQILVGEAIVWVVEYVFYGCCFRFTKRLLWLVIAANGLTYGMSYVLLLI